MTVFVVATFFLWLGFEFTVVCLRRKRIDAVNSWVPRWARFNLKVFGVQLQAHGKYLDDGLTYPSHEAGEAGETDTIGRIFIANHRSGMDIPILFAVAETHVISRHDIATWPLLGRSARRIGTLFVDRESRRSGALVLREIDKNLKQGEAIAMFPEGTAHVGDQVHEFQQGAFNAARRAGAEIIPLGLAYSDDTAYFAGQPFLKHMTRIACLPSLRVAVEVGDPLSFDENRDESSGVELKELAREKVQELVNQARKRLQE
jgi:1-acyl-sn-glycerol-3-phosphate acyltransferase